MIEIYTLGTCSLLVDGTAVTELAGRANKLRKLLHLLLTSRGAPVSIPNIVEVLWPDDEIEDCNKALHNLVFRLRKVLRQAPGAKSPIHYCHNSYALHAGEGMYVDAYEFEDNYRKAMSACGTAQERVGLLERTVSLYKGRYLMDSYGEAWAMPHSSRYRRMHTELVVALADLYLSQTRYRDATRICETAASLEPLEEAIHDRLIRALQHTGQKLQAISVCENLFELLYRELGVGAADNINALYRELKQNVIQTRHSVAGILRALDEQEEENRAFACNMETFRSIYRYEVRQSVRRREAICLALLSITDPYGNPPDAHALNHARSCLFQSCLRTLRRGDVVAGYSSSQVMVLLAGLARENEQIVLDRIRRRFAQLHPAQDVRIECETKPMRVHAAVERFGRCPDLRPPLAVHSPRATRRPVGSVL